MKSNAVFQLFQAGATDKYPLDIRTVKGMAQPNVVKGLNTRPFSRLIELE